MQNSERNTMTDMRDKYENSTYRYGKWAGYPQGHAQDKTRCVQPVWHNERWSRESQCNNKRGHGPGGCYCKTHDPEVVKARRAKSDKAATEKWEKEMLGWVGPSMLKALRKIARRSNDPIGDAQECLKELGYSWEHDGQFREGKGLNDG